MVAVCPGMPRGPLPTSDGSRRAMLDTLVRNLPMVRLRVSLAFAVGLVLAGCVGEITTPGGPDEDEATAAARTAFEDQVMPILDGFCAACHSGMPNIDFMRPD